MVILWGFLVFIIFGMAGRLRGSDLLPNDTVARYGVWGGTVGVFVGILTLNPVYAFLAIPLAGIGATLGYWGSFDLSNPVTHTVSNYAKLTAVGCFRMLPLCIAAIWPGMYVHIIPAVFAGFTFVPSYLLALRMPVTAGLWKLFDQFTCWGEFFFWGSVGLFLCIGLYL